MVYSGAFLAYWHFVLPPVDDEDDQVANNGRSDAEDYDVEDEEELEPIFIPLGWTKARPRTYYKGSDPEWQEFRRIAPDHKRHAKMRDQLVSIVRTTIANDPRFTKRMGDINITIGAHWLDITFPDGPPIEYERSGIEIGDDHITWTTRPVTQLNYHRLNRAIYPTAVFSSIYASTSYLFTQHTRQIKQYLGLSTAESTQHPRIHSGKARTAKSSTSSTDADADAAQRTATPSNVPPAPPPQKETSAAPAPGSNPKEKKVSLPEFTTAPTQSAALHIFAHTLSRNWKPPPLEAPRGTIVVSGLVEVKGTKARMTMDVSGAYDPKQDKYVLLRGAVRRIQDMSQAPRGGH